MYRIAFLAACVLCCTTGPGAASDTTLSLAVDGRERTAYLHTPQNLDPAKRYPLVLGFHGGGGNATGYIATSQIFAKGGDAGYIVVCPEGSALAIPGDHRIWNSGPEYVRSSGDADDVKFTRLLIDKVASGYPLDQKRVFATGFSNGGQMVYRLALELSDRIAAIAPMSGGRLSNGLRPDRPVPVIHFHGTADSVYPLEGGVGQYSVGHMSHEAIANVIGEWIKFDGAQPSATISSQDGWDIQTHEGPSPVVLTLVNGMGHQIAGGGDDHLPHQAAKSSPDAIAMALAFFSAHPMP